MVVSRGKYIACITTTHSSKLCQQNTCINPITEVLVVYISLFPATVWRFWLNGSIQCDYRRSQEAITTSLTHHMHHSSCSEPRCNFGSCEAVQWREGKSYRVASINYEMPVNESLIYGSKQKENNNEEVDVKMMKK